MPAVTEIMGGESQMALLAMLIMKLFSFVLGDAVTWT